MKEEYALNEYAINSGQIKKMYVTQNDQFLFIATYNDKLVQFSTREERVVKKYDIKFDIRSIVATPDNRYLYVGAYSGELSQISIRDQTICKEFGIIMNGRIYSMVVSSDSKN